MSTHGDTAEVSRLLLRPDEAAKALAISTRKLWELTNCGEIPCIRIGRAVRYAPDELRSWIDRQKKSTLNSLHSGRS